MLLYFVACFIFIKSLSAFTGTNGDWQKESFDLSNYAGQKVLVSFRYLTDWGSKSAGWFIDNIQIPEIGYLNDGSSTDALTFIYILF